MPRLRRKQGMTKKVGRTTKKVGRTSGKARSPGWAALFSSNALARLLTVFLTHPEASFYQKELLEAAKARAFTVQREVARLEAAGLVVKTPRGNRVYYQANRRHPAFEDLKRVVLKTIGLGEALRAALAPLADRVQAAFIFGSYARGQETAESDIDLFMIGALGLRGASEVLGPAGRDLGREFNPTVYTPEEFRSKVRECNPFVTEVLKGEKIYLIGDDSVLAQLAR